MSGIIDHCSSNDRSYGHGIICQNCFAQKCCEKVFAVELLSIGTFVQVLSVRHEDVLIRIVDDDMQVGTNELLCKKADIIHVPDNLWGPLFTVKKSARLLLVKDGKLAESIANIAIGHTVQVLGSDNKSICIANVTFRNHIGRLGVGVFFGLQIISSKENIQTIINKISLLEPGTKGFPRGCDIVVTIDKIRPWNSSYLKEKSAYLYDKENQKDLVKTLSSGEDTNNTNFKPVIVLNLKDKLTNTLRKSLPTTNTNQDYNINHVSTKKIVNSENPLEVGEEVIYLDGDTPEKGVVRWIGHIKNYLKVGVEFDNPIGSGTGTLDGIELFRSRYNHALIVPPMALIKLSDYMTNNPKDAVHNKNNNNNINNNNPKSIVGSSINNNNINNNNINYDNFANLKSEDFFCEGKHGMEEKYKASKVPSCFWHPEKTFHFSDSFQCKNSEEISQGKHSCVSDAPRTQHVIELQHNSKSLDFVRQSEKKMTCRKPLSSLDGDLSYGIKEPKVQSTTVSTPKTPIQDFYDLMGPNWGKTERNHEYCVEKESGSFVSCKSSVCHSNELIFKNHKGKESWKPHNLEQNSSQDSIDHLYDIPKSESFINEELGKGSLVELTYKGEPHYGVIRWIGSISEGKDGFESLRVAGIEMEEETNGFTDGTFNGRRYFQCNPGKALFVPLSKCRKDSRFLEENQRHFNSSKINYGQIDCPIVEGTVPPINTKGDVESICGKNRGIQGHHNSCYLDATLFAMFAFTSVFDSLLYRPPAKNDIPQYNEVQRVLREEIVNPLRKNLYVRADRVMKLRTLLDKLSSVSGLTSEEKDPEEFLNSLLAQILKAEPFLKLSSGQETFHYQLFVEKDERLVFPSVQQLFEQSFVTSDIKLKQVPSCLIIQMPRFGKSFKMYSRISPPLLLDITDIIENSPRQCTVCGKLAEYECKDCFGQHGIGNGLESISFCKLCLETAHNHHCRTRHNYRSLTVPVEFYELQEHCIIPRLYLELFAVVCIETSHYVAFVKCGSGSDAPWCFFDSMADRKGEQNGYNIPEMVPCPDLPYWLSEDGAKMLNEMGDERQLPEHAKRLFSDAYMCMYQSPDLMMYR